MTELVAAAAAYVDEVLALLENVTSSMQKRWEEMSSEGSVVDTIVSFVRAVDWTEPWLIALMCFHAVLFVSAIVTRNNNTSQMTLFFTGLMGIYFAEKFNGFLDKHWKSFAGQPYFDRHGVFLSTVWSVPILLMTTVILVNSLFMLMKLLVKWKRAELRHRARESESRPKSE